MSGINLKWEVEMNDKPRYGTVPISLLRNIHIDQKGTIRKMIDYTLYDRMIKENPYYAEEEPDAFEEPAMEGSMEYFNLLPNDLKGRMERGKEIYDTLHGTPNASISIKKMLEFQERKTEFDLMVFSFYCAIRSIVGTKPYYKGTNEFWLARAFGYSTVKEYQNAETTQAEKDLRVRYSKRDWLKKVKLTLQNDWYLIYVSTNKYIRMRGYYVSFKMDLEALAIIVKGKNDKYKIKENEREAVMAKIFG